ncbi:hypothetical protein D3C81_1532900 [compost metagenome]
MRQRVIGQAVGADHRGRMAQDAVHIGIFHAVIDRPGRLQAARGFQQVDVPLGGDVGQQAAAHGRVRLRPRDLDVEIAGHLLEI